MKNFLLVALTTTLLLPTSSKSDTKHFGAGGVFELDLGDSEIPLTPKQEREQQLMANLSDQDIRSIKASAQGMTTHQYELFLRDIGIRFK